jgi:hypothetical protein
VQAMLDIWPLLLLSIHANLNAKDADKGDIISALEHHDRMAGIHLWRFNNFQLKKCIGLMQQLFPVLRYLELKADEKATFVIPDAFLGGSAPLLQSIHLDRIGFPGLPKLLSSAIDLVNVNLDGIPTTGKGHISPDAMTTGLSALTHLRRLNITFLRQTYPTDQHPPSSAHAVLPALTSLRLEGPHGYIEDFLGRLDAHLLKSSVLNFYNQPTFDTPRVPHFIHRTKLFKLLGGFGVSFYTDSIDR